MIFLLPERQSMRVFLHIGTDKTGSSAIQRHLRKNRDWFRSRSVYIPACGWGVGNGHYALLSDLDPRMLEQLSLELAAAAAEGAEMALLTWEGMCAFRGRQIDVLCRALKAYEISVVVYLREQAGIIQSGFLQQVKTNKNIHKMRVFERPRNPWEALLGAIHRRHPRRNYLRMLNRWQCRLPSADFLVRVFSRRRLVDGDIVSDFLAQLGLAEDTAFQRDDVEINPSLDVESALLVEKLQSRGLAAEDIARRVDISLSHINQFGSSSKYFLDKHTVGKIRRHFYRSNLRLARRYMDSDENPFATEKACWREETFEAIEQRARILSGKIEEVDRIPTLMQRAKKDMISSKVALLQGWGEQQPWGVWSDGAQSRIRFRIMRRKAVLWENLRVSLTGRYHGTNIATAVQINGVDYGEQNLEEPGEGLLLPTAALLPFEIVEITLNHSQPAAHGEAEAPADRWEIAFALTKISCKVERTQDPLPSQESL